MPCRISGVVALALTLSFAALAGPIAGVSIASVSGEAVGAPWDLRAIHLVDGSGLTGDLHGTCYDQNTCWQNGFGGLVPATIVFDLGATYDLASMHVWNGYWGNFQSGRGAHEVDVSTSSDLSLWIDQGTFNFPEAPTTVTDYAGFDVPDLAWAGARYVRFQINSNWGGGDCGSCITMSEVQFFQAAGQGEAPEPATVVLAAGALACLWWRRRVPSL